MRLSSSHLRALLLVGSALFVLVLLRGWLFWSHVTAPLTLGETRYLDVPSGANLTRVLRDLEEREILADAGDLLLYAKLTDQASAIQAGEYALNAGLSGRGLLTLLESGRVVYHQLRIGEGWTLRQAIESIQRHPAITRELDAGDRDAIRRAFGTEHYPEGMFFPDTYNFTRGTSDLALLQRAHALMQEKLAQHWQGRAVGLPYDSPYDALIMASIIEKETALLPEQPQIAGVFVRRLQRNMRLQTDPTVIYGLGPAFDGDLTRSQLLADTPWNTYTRGGLPQTPIALPGESALVASMHPAESDTLYFVARGDGSHQFSATLEEHNAAVRRFQLNRGAD